MTKDIQNLVLIHFIMVLVHITLELTYLFSNCYSVTVLGWLIQIINYMYM